jgi:hypothetical protein
VPSIAGNASRLRPPGHAVYHVVADRTITATPNAELAARWYPGVPLRGPMEGNAAFYYSTARATADLGWDPAVDHPEIGPANGPASRPLSHDRGRSIEQDSIRSFPERSDCTASTGGEHATNETDMHTNIREVHPPVEPCTVFIH